MDRSTERLIARLRFRHLRLLCELQRSGSLRAAAAALNLSQPALSKALSEVESAFGFALFIRTQRGLTATAQGEAAVRGAAQLLEELAHVHAEAAAGEVAQAQVRIGAPPFVAQGFLPEVIVRLRRRTPPVQVRLLEERVPLLMDMLAQGTVDALVTSYPLERPAREGVRLHFEKLFDAGFVVIAHPKHPLAGARGVPWKRLAAEPWVMPASVSMVRRVIDEAFMRQGVVPPVPVVESTSPVTNIRLVAAGAGLCAVPADLARAPLAAGEIQRVGVSPAVPPGPVALVWRAGAVNPRVAMLREVLKLA